MAHYFLEFAVSESCGKCAPCRLGTRQLLAILKDIVDGKGSLEDLDLLAEVGTAVQQGSLCGLGQTAPNPVLTTLRYFREEYEAHVRDRHCPAGVCTALLTYTIDPEKCTGCRACAVKCPVKCIDGEKKKRHGIHQERCVRCGACFDVCRFDAVTKK
jgi:NAD-dependent dihydropyrimidine dehydrogenase PreA subunit